MDPRKLLIAVDGSANAIRAVHYVGDMLQHATAATIKLLHIERFPDRDLFKDESSWKDNCAQVRRDMETYLEEARMILVNKGIARELITTSYIVSCISPLTDDKPCMRCSRNTSIAQEILGVLKEEGFGTVVVGRRGVSKAEEFLFGSVSNRIIHHAKGCTVWVVA